MLSASPGRKWEPEAGMEWEGVVMERWMGLSSVLSLHSLLTPRRGTRSQEAWLLVLTLPLNVL